MVGLFVLFVCFWCSFPAWADNHKDRKALQPILCPSGAQTVLPPVRPQGVDGVAACPLLVGKATCATQVLSANSTWQSWRMKRALLTRCPKLWPVAGGFCVCTLQVRFAGHGPKKFTSHLHSFGTNQLADRLDELRLFREVPGPLTHVTLPFAVNPRVPEPELGTKTASTRCSITDLSFFAFPGGSISRTPNRLFCHARLFGQRLLQVVPRQAVAEVSKKEPL